ncbi:hypothetical protein V495_08478 [Pseudogymnoascus sp. VKM F-4514 (FW-929)]|nr:hypothetical protein V495_08478 [Pseudogymnoascus sp. VKM F-4514 (FW-929)]KFY55119.1 hypothetical protein V497_07175 [Pseudogymnoascus sp. VKM F-4516 (FW-969)]
MADALTIVFATVSILSSAITVTALLFDSAKKFKDGEPELQKQLEEFSVLRELLTECESVFESGITIQRSAIGAFTTLRMNQQFVNVSAGITQIMLEYSDPEPEDAAVSLNSQDYDREVDNVDEHTGSIPRRIQADEFYQRQRPRTRADLQKITQLIKTNFTRNVALAVEIGPHNFKYVPTRAKLDTGSDENLVSLRLLKEAGINEDLWMPIQEEQGVKLSGVVGAVEPEFIVELAWYEGQEMKMQRSKFYIVENPDFDIVIGTKRITQELTKNYRQNIPAYVLASRRRTKGRNNHLDLDLVLCCKDTDSHAAEGEAARANHERHLQVQREVEIADLQASHQAREVQQALRLRVQGSRALATEMDDLEAGNQTRRQSTI